MGERVGADPRSARRGGASALAMLALALPAAAAAAVAVLIAGGGIVMAVIAYSFAGSATLLAAALLASPLRLASLEAWRPRLQSSNRAAAPLVGR